MPGREKVPSVTAGEVNRLVGEGAVLLDVREDDEWQAGHAPEAVHIPLGQLSASMDRLPRGRAIVAICRSGGRSGLATKALLEAGHDAVNLEGGMKGWAASGLPITTDSGAAGAVI